MKLPTLIKKYIVYGIRYIGIFVFVSSYILSTPYYILTTHALEISSTYPVADTAAVQGDIVSSGSQGLSRSAFPYDNHIFGVINDDATLAYKNVNPGATDHLIAQTGTASVNVTDYNGKIAVGDPITSSAIPGKGSKAIQTGYIIGTAISIPTEGGQISFQGKQYTTAVVVVSLRIEYAELSTPRSTLGFLNSISSSILQSSKDPAKFTLVIKYIMAGLVVVTAFALSFFTFARSISKSIEAVGRNPLARSTIQLSVIVQVVLTILTLVTSVVIAFIIIRL
jgi:F0F1-type ATP synthase membrane subunit c/vacuolar-type H+-ATPase subunit K